MPKKVRVTQLMIARRVRLDVSSVNKILNYKYKSGKFRVSTRQKVFEAAKKLGYVVKPDSKGQLSTTIELLKQIVKSNIPDYEKVKGFAMTLRVN